jgi:putative oxidoreductase
MKAWYFRWIVPPATLPQSLFLLVVRLYWGWGFFRAGSGKLHDLEKPTEFFQSLGIPFPHAQAILVSLTESVGGLLLLVGLCARLISLPLTVLLTVAYLTADLDRVKVIFSDPDKFVTADEFLFLFAVLLVLFFGPGKFSIDWLIGRRRG